MGDADDAAALVAAEVATQLLERLRGGVALPAPTTAPAPVPVDQEWLTVAQAARHLGSTRAAIYAQVERAQLPAHKIGRRGLRLRRSEIDRALAARRTGAPVRAIETVRRPVDDDFACVVARKSGGDK